MQGDNNDKNSKLNNQDSIPDQINLSFWLKSTVKKPIEKINQKEDMKKNFSAKDFLGNHFSPADLSSKNNLLVSEFLKDLLIEVQTEFRFDNLTGIQQKLIYEQFENYFSKNPESALKLNFEYSFNQFSQMLVQIEEGISDPVIQQFLNEYFKQVAILSLLKMKFVIEIANELGQSINKQNLINTHGFLLKIFKTNSSLELYSQGMQTNQYSWFRPSAATFEHHKTLIDAIKSTNILEFYKISKLHNNSMVYDSLTESRYFGDLLTELLVFFPRWMQGHKISRHDTEGERTTLNTLFIGEKLFSLGLSHWKSQMSNTKGFWKEVITPFFHEEKNGLSTFSKVVQEFIFMIFVIRLSHDQNSDPIGNLIKLMKDKNSKHLNRMSEYISNDLQAKFDRIILNLPELPKNNAHFNLLSHIQNAQKKLSENGVLYILTNQKLFVPSMSEKVKDLFTELKMIGHLSFEDLKMKGDCPQYIYICSKRVKKDDVYFINPSVEHKDSTLTFNCSGKLTTQSSFLEIKNALANCIEQKSIDSFNVYSKDIGDLSFSFHFDAIINGKLLSLQNTDKHQFTHPNFLKNLTKKTLPLDHFAQIITLNQEYSKKETFDFSNSFFEINEDHYPYIIIVDLKNNMQTRLDIIDRDSYLGRKEELGTAHYQYFGLNPKNKDLNITLLKEYFSSLVGLQIIQLGLQGNSKKIKAKLKAILVPTFVEHKEIPEKVPDLIKIAAQKTKEELLKMRPEELIQIWPIIQEWTDQNKTTYPWYCMGTISHFKSTIQSCLAQFNKKKSIDFSNPIILDQIMKGPIKNIYPKNEDIFIKPIFETKDELKLKIDRLEWAKSDDNNKLCLLSKDSIKLEVYAHDYILQFIEYITTRSANISFNDFLTNLKVPTEVNIKFAIDNYFKTRETFEELENVISQKLSFSFQQIISNSNN